MIIDRSQCPIMQLLVDRTRRADTAGSALANAHRKIGAALAPFAASKCKLEIIDIKHVAGVSSGRSIKWCTTSSAVYSNHSRNDAWRLICSRRHVGMFTKSSSYSMGRLIKHDCYNSN